VHFWSLAVEEQFYLCWPLLLSGVYLVTRRAGDRQWKVLRLIIVAGFAVSLVSALHLSTVNLSRAYYGTDTRPMSCSPALLLAITPWVMRVARRRRRLVQASAPIALAALVCIATSTIHLGAIQRGVAATLATSALIVALEVSKGGVLRRALSTPSMVVPGARVVRDIPLALARNRDRDAAIPAEPGVRVRVDVPHRDRSSLR
jgi:peptidoglycan/LPS O-acetylase OafA/YrhL